MSETTTSKAITKKEQLDIIKDEIASIYKRRCKICHAQYKHLKGFQIHHIWYEANDAYYANFKNELEYKIALLEKIKDNPDRFVLVCHKHHHAVEIMARYAPDKFSRLASIIRRMHKGRKAIAQGDRP